MQRNVCHQILTNIVFTDNVSLDFEKNLYALLSFHILKKQHREKAEMDVNKKWMGSAGRIERLKQNLGHIF